MNQESKKIVNLDAIKNPTQEIFFFRHDKKKLCYILMSLQISIEEFYLMFPAAQKITEEECGTLCELNKFQVVFVGDDHIIDTYFTEKQVARAKRKK